MPSLTFTRAFTIRAYECDAYGHLNNVNYLRLMQETAFDASRAAGYDGDRYEREGLVWLIRENHVEYLRPIRYRDEVEVTTWIEDFRRVRSRRRYEFRVVGDDNLAAIGTTDWVLVDTKTHEPRRIPDGMVEAFAPGGLSEPAESPPPFPQVPEPPSGAVIYPHRIEFADLDSMQHLNNANYLAIAENAGGEVARRYGWSLSHLLANGHGWAARAMRIEYRGQPRLDDVVEVTTFLAEPRKAGARRYYLFNDQATGDLIARAYYDWIFIDIASGRPTRIPAELYKDFAANLVGEP